jgi:hypothetical protein
MNMHIHKIDINPREIRLLKLNARFMRHETFQRLVENIRGDGALTSAPFGWLVHDDDTQELVHDENGQPIHEVLSGNHRIKAAIEVGLETIDYRYTDEYLDPDRRKGIQLSHNSITGEDDPDMLKLIYDSIDDVQMKVYSGLDDVSLQLMEEVSIGALREANLTFQSIQLLFLPDELEAIEAAFASAQATLAGNHATWLARFSEYDELMDSLEAIGMAHDIRNTATCLMVMVEVFTRNIGQLSGAFLDRVGDTGGAEEIPVEVILGERLISATTAARLSRALGNMEDKEQLVDGKSGLDVLLDKYWESEGVDGAVG